MIKRQHWKYFIYVLMVLYVVFIVTSVSILNRLMQEGQTYTLRATRETRELRIRFNELENILPSLFSSPEMRLNEVLRELKRQEATELDALRRLEEHYEGDPERMASLKQAISFLGASQREAAEKLEGNMSYELASAYFRNTFRPQLATIDNILANISQDIDDHTHEIHAEMHHAMNLIILASLVFGSAIIVIAILYDRRVNAAASELAYREELFRQLARNIDEVFVIAINGKSYEYVGQNSERLLNLPARELYEKPEALGSFMAPEDAEWLATILNGPGLANPVERDITLPDSGRFLKIRIYSIRVPSTQAERFIIVINDQTEITNHQLALSDALENAHAASAAKSSFLSHMSHEIRTPMNAIIGMTTIALSRINDQGRVQDCLGKIADSSKHLLGLINDVLDMSKIESGKLTICNEDFNLRQTIDNIGNMVQAQARHKKQTFEIFLENIEEENLVGDAMRLNQVLLNILSNSLKFTPEGGKISLRLIQSKAGKSGVQIRFVISDTGIGMSPEFLEKLYAPFEQAHANTAARYGGTGLGMPITMNLVTMMGGTINVESREGHGTTFTLDIPFGLSGEHATRPDTLPPLRVLVVDDDHGTCEHANLLLEKMGLKPSWTMTGRHAVEMVKESLARGEPYDVCLIDWRMPEMNGAETAAAIRSIAGAEMLIIIISAYDLGPIEEDARKAGVNNFIAKPFFASTLFDALAGATRKGAAQESGPGPSHDFTGKRVLLVEDNEFNREIGQEFLEMVNIEVENAENGKEGVEKLTSSPKGYYDLVLMDVQMPIMDGYEATRAIRASDHPEAATIPIIAMTANAFSEDVTKAVASGMNAHIAKPIDVNDLYAVLARYLKQA